MDSGVWNSLLAKSFNRDSVEGYGHAGLLSAPAFYRFTLFDNRDIFNFVLQLTELFREGFSQVFAGVGDHLLEKATAVNTVTKELGLDWSAQAPTVTIAVVQRWCHGAIVFLAG